SRNIRRQLNQKRPFCDLASASDQIMRGLRIAREKDAAFFCIRAGYVQLITRDTLRILEPLENSQVVFHPVSEYIRKNRNRVAAQLRKFVSNKGVDSHILE